jgi:hypothetical protein
MTAPVRPRDGVERRRDPSSRLAGLDLLACAVVLLDVEGRTKFLNQAAEQLFEMPQRVIEGSVFARQFSNGGIIDGTANDPATANRIRGVGSPILRISFGDPIGLAAGLVDSLLIGAGHGDGVARLRRVHAQLTHPDGRTAEVAYLLSHPASVAGSSDPEGDIEDYTAGVGFDFEKLLGFPLYFDYATVPQAEVVAWVCDRWPYPKMAARTIVENNQEQTT